MKCETDKSTPSLHRILPAATIAVAPLGVFWSGSPPGIAGSMLLLLVATAVVVGLASKPKRQRNERIGRILRTGLGALAVLAVFASGSVLRADPPVQGIPGPVREGVYTMMKISGGSLMGLGDLEIRGTTYQAAGEGGFKPFTIDGRGNITWSAGLNIMPDGWKLGTSTYTKDEKGRPLIKIYYTSPRGALEVIDALKEK
jgi:hypothetical protein